MAQEKNTPPPSDSTATGKGNDPKHDRNSDMDKGNQQGQKDDAGRQPGTQRQGAESTQMEDREQRAGTSTPDTGRDTTGQQPGGMTGEDRNEGEPRRDAGNDPARTKADQDRDQAGKPSSEQGDQGKPQGGNR